MLAPRSSALGLLLLGACFTDSGGPALVPGATTREPETTQSPTTQALEPTSTGTGTAPTSAAPETTSTGITDAIDATAALTTDETTDTGCVLTPWYLDIDKDGYGGAKSIEGCGPPPPGYTAEPLDCDDSKPAIHPGAEELCDHIDNDCDLRVDEYPAGSVEPCNGCLAVLAEASVYYFCGAPLRDWDSARAHCKTLLGDLVIINSLDEHQFLVNQIPNNKPRWWIGLGDSAVESEFVWVDGSPLDPQLSPWANNEPNNMDNNIAGPADCVAIAMDTFPPGLWRDQSCQSLRLSVCEADDY